MAKSVVPCPECKFPNMEGANRCLACGVDLLNIPLDALMDPEELETVAGLTPPPIETRKFVTGRQPTKPEAPQSGRQPQVEEEVMAWLSCEALPPIALGPHREVTLGRSRECQLILPHKTVSRVHGTVRVDDGRILYEDTSSYGSLLNGVRLSGPVEVSVGDRISVGPYDVKVCPAADPQGEVGEEKTQPLDLTPFRARSTTAELMGSLAHGMLIEVLQGLEFNCKTGTLQVRSEDGEGSLTVREGSPCSARLGSLEGEDAIFAMLNLTRGTFAFSATDAEPDGSPFSRPLTTILFEATRRRDESRQDR